jgi:hypothetical protein
MVKKAVFELIFNKQRNIELGKTPVMLKLERLCDALLSHYAI